MYLYYSIKFCSSWSSQPRTQGSLPHLQFNLTHCEKLSLFFCFFVQESKSFSSPEHISFSLVFAKEETSPGGSGWSSSYIGEDILKLTFLIKMRRSIVMAVLREFSLIKDIFLLQKTTTTNWKYFIVIPINWKTFCVYFLSFPFVLYIFQSDDHFHPKVIIFSGKNINLCDMRQMKECRNLSLRNKTIYINNVPHYEKAKSPGNEVDIPKQVWFISFLTKCPYLTHAERSRFTTTVNSRYLEYSASRTLH